MGQLKNFIIEAEEAGADVRIAYENFSKGEMLWDQAISEALPEEEDEGEGLDLPGVTLGDATKITDLADGAQASVESALVQIRTLLQQRDLVEQWDDESASFKKHFLPLAQQYHALERALGELTGRNGDPIGLNVYMEAQR